jgi:hypothetical protein
MRFSERHGYSRVRAAIQFESMDNDLRVDLWNYSLQISTSLIGEAGHAQQSTFCRDLQATFFKRPIDELGYVPGVQLRLKEWILETSWHRVYDLLEFLVEEVHDLEDSASYEECIERYNQILENNLAAYRFVGGVLAPMDSAVDLAAVEDALADAGALAGVQHHLARALDLLADRQSPDYSNSIKESISAVESLCALITKEKTLGAAIKRLKGNGFAIHPALERAWLSLYGYTSDADGIRHFAVDAPTVDQAQAKYFLVSCSAFVSLLIAEAARVGISLESQCPPPEARTTRPGGGG